MNTRNCPRCQQPNALEVRFCYACGLDFAAVNFNQPPPPVAPPNFQPVPPPANFQSGQMPQPNFQPPSPSGFQPPPQNWQSLPHVSKPRVSGKQIALGIGGILFGLIMLASGGLKFFNSFSGGRTSSQKTSNTVLANSNTRPALSFPAERGSFKLDKTKTQKVTDITVVGGAVEGLYGVYLSGADKVEARQFLYKNPADAKAAFNKKLETMKDLGAKITQRVTLNSSGETAWYTDSRGALTNLQYSGEYLFDTTGSKHEALRRFIEIEK